MKKKKLIIWIVVAVLLVAAVTVALFLLLGKDQKEPDSDGDGRPDSVDVEPEDDLSDDNVYKIDDHVPNPNSK